MAAPKNPSETSEATGSDASENQGYLELAGHLLIAMPGMIDDRFARSVILICNHDAEGSMGFVLNQPVESPKFEEILEELKLDDCADQLLKSGRDITVFRGGPVEQGRGFVLHSLDYSTPASSRVGDLVAVSATLDALRKLCSNEPPQNAVMLLGYSGWGPGQLESEIVNNGWLSVPATGQLIFQTATENQYDAALAEIGIDQASLSSSGGSA
ncbi:MAG: YqgE/AlgH family protein [Pseudomonadota bacterium]